MASFAKFFCDSDSLKDLDPGRHGYIDGLNDRWRDRYEQHDSVKPFLFSAGYELAPLFLTGIVVEKKSATAYSQKISAFKKDHATIAKPLSISDPVYVWVRQRLLNEAPRPVVKKLSEAEEKSYTETIKKLQKELKGTDLEEALKLISEGQLDKALSLLSEKETKEDVKVVEIARARFAKAQVYQLKLDYHNSLTYYEKAVQLAPNNTLYLNEAGLMLSILGKYDTAIEYYEKALSSVLKTFSLDHPEVALHWNNLGAAWTDKGKYVKAIEYHEKALSSNLKNFGLDHPHVAEDWNNLGVAWDLKGEHDKAIEYYEKALSSDLKTLGPEHPSVAVRWNNLGKAWDDKGEHDKAIEYYEKALEIYEKANLPHLVKLVRRGILILKIMR